jgi:hypothetical protein
MPQLDPRALHVVGLAQLLAAAAHRENQAQMQTQLYQGRIRRGRPKDPLARPTLSAQWLLTLPQ